MTPQKIFQDLFGARECLNIKKKNGIYLQYSECSPLQKIQHVIVDRSSLEIFPGLSRTLSFNFQNFPGPK